MPRRVWLSCLRYGLALTAVAIAGAIRFWLDPLLGSSYPFFAFILAALVIAFSVGMGPAIVATLVGGIVSLCFLPPRGTPVINDLGQLFGIGAYTVICISVVVLAELLRQSRWRAEESLREARRQREEIRVTLTSIADAVIATDIDTRINYLNPMAESLTGWTAAEAIGRPLFDVLHLIDPATRTVVDSHITRVVKHGAVTGISGNSVLISRDGVERSIEDTIAPIRGEAGEIGGAVLVFRDVSERKQADAAKFELAAIVESSEDAIIGKTFDGIIKTWNAGAERLYGYSAAEAIGRPLSLLVAPDMADDFPHILDRLKRSEQIEHYESSRVRKDGTRIEVSSRLSPIKDGSGRVVGVSVVARDITQRKIAEQRRNARLAVTQILAQATEVEDALARILPAIGENLDWEVGCAWLLDQAGQSLCCCQTWSSRRPELNAFAERCRELTFSRGDSLPGRVWDRHAPLWVADVVSDSEFRRAEFANEAHLHGAFACPITHGGELFGVIEFFSSQIREPDDDLLEMVDTIGGQIGQLIERQRVERERESLNRDLQRRVAEFQTLLDVIPVGIAVANDTSLEKIWINCAMAKTLNLPADAHLSFYARSGDARRYFTVFRQGRELALDELPISVCVATGAEVRHEELDIVLPDGQRKKVFAYASPLFDEGGKTRGCVSAYLDVTEWRQAQQLLRQTDERLTLALSASRMGWWDWNVATGEVVWSDELGAFGNAGAGRFEGTFDSFTEHIFPADRLPLQQAARKAIEDRQDFEFEFRVVRQDGSLRWSLAKGQVLYDEAGKPSRLVGVDLDITERKRLESELQQRASQLIDADRRKDEFLAMLAHELRNPLAPIRNALYILQMPNVEEAEVRQAKEIMFRQVQHIGRLVDDLLDVSRIMRGRIELRREPIALSAIVARAVETSRAAIDAQEHELVVSLPGEPLELEADLIRLAQVLSNLLNNAAKYTPKRGHIWLTAARQDQEVRLSVRDDGMGISAELLPHVFDLFTQAETSIERSQGGLGIGLTLVRSLVAMHSGRVEALSDGPGKGSEFVLYLPIRSQVSPAQNGTPADPDTNAASVSRDILVVDDNVDAAESLAVVLKMSGHQVRIAYDGLAALQLATEHRPEVILLDIGLPGMSGYEVARKLRQLPQFQSTLLLAMTGYGQDEDRRRSKQAGFDHHLTKPVDPSALQDLLSVVD